MNPAQSDEQAPVAYVGEVSEGAELMLDKPNGWEAIPLYTAPPSKPWVGLTLADMPETYSGDRSFLHGAVWAEAKLKEKNVD